MDDEKTVLMRDLQLTASKQEFETYLGFTVVTGHCMKPTDFNGGYGLTVSYARLFTTVQAQKGPKSVYYTE